MYCLRKKQVASTEDVSKAPPRNTIKDKEKNKNKENKKENKENKENKKGKNKNNEENEEKENNRDNKKKDDKEDDKEKYPWVISQVLPLISLTLYGLAPAI